MNPRKLYIQPALLQTVPELPPAPDVAGSCPEHESEPARYCRGCIADVKCGDRFTKYLGKIQPRCIRWNCSGPVDGDAGLQLCWEHAGARRRHLFVVQEQSGTLTERTAT